MYFQFLVEDQSTEYLIKHVMEKLKEWSIREKGKDSELYYDIKSFHGIGHLKKTGSIQERKTGMLLNDLPAILRGMGKALQKMDHATIVIVMDNDRNDPEILMSELQNMAATQMVFADHEFCLAMPYEGAKEMLLVDKIENKEFLKELLEGMYGELPATKKKKK